MRKWGLALALAAAASTTACVQTRQFADVQFTPPQGNYKLLVLRPDVTVSQVVLLLTAVQGHAVPVVTVTEPVPPAAVSDWLAELRVKPQAAWLTVNVNPAIVRVPLRVVDRLLAVALNATLPDPVPDEPDVTVSQDVLLLTPVHAHPAPAVTVTLPVAPFTGTD